jgi:hypothetical protein
MPRGTTTSIISSLRGDSLDAQMTNLAKILQDKKADQKQLHLVFFPGKAGTLQTFGHIGIFHNKEYFSFGAAGDFVKYSDKSSGFPLDIVLADEAKKYGSPVLLTLPIQNQVRPNTLIEGWSDGYNVLKRNCVHAAIAYLSAVSTEYAGALKSMSEEMSLRPFALAEKICAIKHEFRKKAILEAKDSNSTGAEKIEQLISLEIERLTFEVKIRQSSILSQIEDKLCNTLGDKIEKIQRLKQVLGILEHDKENKNNDKLLIETIKRIGGRTALNLASCIQFTNNPDPKRIYCIKLYHALQDPSLKLANNLSGEPEGIRALRKELKNNEKLLFSSSGDLSQLYTKIMGILENRAAMITSTRQPKIQDFYDTWLKQGRTDAKPSTAVEQQPEPSRTHRL